MKARTQPVAEQVKSDQSFEASKSLEDRIRPYAGKLVLVAEDDEVNAMVFVLFIREKGADAIIATDGLQALTLAKQKKPDLIFMDVHMPFFSGLDAIKEIRNVDCQCPIVSLSASTRLNERQNSLDAGASEFLVKPVNRDAIDRILERYLQEQ
jgi:two-component system chemotaxis sensor kinase CheA